MQIGFSLLVKVTFWRICTWYTGVPHVVSWASLNAACVWYAYVIYKDCGQDMLHRYWRYSATDSFVLPPCSAIARCVDFIDSTCAAWPKHGILRSLRKCCHFSEASIPSACAQTGREKERGARGTESTSFSFHFYANLAASADQMARSLNWIEAFFIWTACWQGYLGADCWRERKGTDRQREEIYHTDAIPAG